MFAVNSLKQPTSVFPILSFFAYFFVDYFSLVNVDETGYLVCINIYYSSACVCVCVR